jgi:hypothetical protein
MPRKAFNDRTYFKNDKDEKAAWRKAQKEDDAPDLSEWIRETLNTAAGFFRK